MRRSLLIPSFFFFIGCLALLAHTTSAGNVHLWALRPTAGAFWFYWLLAIVAAAFLFRDAGAPGSEAVSWSSRGLGFGRWSSLILWALLLSSAIVLLFQFRQRLFLAPPDGLGDSLLILEQVPVYTHLLGYLDSFDELLELYWHCRLYLFTSERFGWHVEDAYALLSIASFVLYGSAVFWFLIRRSLFQILTGLALLIFVPALQLFAGYVEHYTMATAWMALAILTGARALELERLRRSGDGAGQATQPATAVAIVAGCAAIAVLHHSITTVILPALIYLVIELAAGNLRKIVRLATVAAAVALPILLSVWTWFLLFAEPPLAFSDSHISSPPVHRPGELFMPAHLRDMLNLLFLASPAALLVLLCLNGHDGSQANPVANIQSGARSARDADADADIDTAKSPGFFNALLAWLAPEPVHLFLLIATLGLGSIAFVIESLIGFPADWDLLTIFQFPLNLFLFYRIVSAWRDQPTTRSGLRIALPLIMVMHGFITTSWIGRNAEATPISQQNVELARKNVSQSLAILEQDPVYERVKQSYADRNKTYIQVKLFFIRSRNRLLAGAGEFSATEQARLLAALESGETRFHEWMQMPPEAFEAGYETLWKDLSELNVRINADGASGE
ncbi:MAG: hypothetical protein NXI24_16350 [bacterium]|nr:hypothetical protein [bacterium]